MARAEADGERRRVQGDARRRSRARLHARQPAGSGPRRRGAASGSLPREQFRAAPAGRGQGRVVGEDRQHQLLQGLRGHPIMRYAILVFAVSALASTALAQSTNTATIVVVVPDQTGAVVPGAQVPTANAATGAVREGTSGSDGSFTVPALPITGAYKVSVAMPGFTSEDVQDVSLRAGETATVKVKLVASGGQSEVTVYGTSQGVRADAQIGRRLDAPTIDETPILGRKITTLPLFNSAFRQGKGTGDLFVNATYFITASGSRRTTTFMLDGASNDEGWGRQTMIATVPIGAVEEVAVLSNAFSAEYGWTSGPAMNIVTKAGTNTVRGEGLYM